MISPVNRDLFFEGRFPRGGGGADLSVAFVDEDHIYERIDE